MTQPLSSRILQSPYDSTRMSPEESHFRNTAQVNPRQGVRGAEALRSGGIKGIMFECLLHEPRDCLGRKKLILPAWGPFLQPPSSLPQPLFHCLFTFH